MKSSMLPPLPPPANLDHYMPPENARPISLDELKRVEKTIAASETCRACALMRGFVFGPRRKIDLLEEMSQEIRDNPDAPAQVDARIRYLLGETLTAMDLERALPHLFGGDS